MTERFYANTSFPFTVINDNQSEPTKKKIIIQSDLIDKEFVLQALNNNTQQARIDEQNMSVPEILGHYLDAAPDNGTHTAVSIAFLSQIEGEFDTCKLRIDELEEGVRDINQKLSVVCPHWNGGAEGGSINSALEISTNLLGASQSQGGE